MAVSSSGFLGTSQFVDLEVNATVEFLSDAAAILHGIFVDNTQNTVDSFVKIWDTNTTGGVNLGTTVPDLVLRVAAGGTIFLPFLIAAAAIANPEGWALGTGLAVACVTAGGTGGTTGPTNAVKATLITD